MTVDEVFGKDDTAGVAARLTDDLYKLRDEAS
jgi:hypothetical protein